MILKSRKQGRTLLLATFCSVPGFTNTRLAVAMDSAKLLASPNDIHNSEKLHNPFWSGSAILNAAPLYVPCKNPHSQLKFRPIALQHTSN